MNAWRKLPSGIAFHIDEGLERKTVWLRVIIPIRTEGKDVVFIYIYTPFPQVFLILDPTVSSLVQSTADMLALQLTKQEHDLTNRGIVALAHFRNGECEILHPLECDPANPDAREDMMFRDGYRIVQHYFTSQ
jgi:hypothetical protein